MSELRGELINRATGLSRSIVTLENIKLRLEPTAALYEAMIDRQKTIYGNFDNRVEATMATPPMYQNIRKVAGLFKRENIRDNGDGTVTLLNYQSFRDRYSLCEKERFGEQPSIAFCTGFAIGTDLIATAGHCVNVTGEALGPEELEDIVIIFGYWQTSGKPVLTFGRQDVYRAVKGIRKLETGVAKGKDYMLLKVDHPIPADRIARLSTTPISLKQSVYVIGHPCGLPMKCAGGAFVRSISFPNCFVSNLDTYGGNSGSPVFNADNDRVEGILVRGNDDFIRNDNCFQSTVCGDTDCLGEDVTRCSVFIQAMQQLSN